MSPARPQPCHCVASPFPPSLFSGEVKKSCSEAGGRPGTEQGSHSKLPARSEALPGPAGRRPTVGVHCRQAPPYLLPLAPTVAFEPPL